MRDLSVLVKPSSHLCNIDCKYCFYKDEAKLRSGDNALLMHAETLELLVKRAFEFADGTVTFVFQGGEPTLMGLEFYQRFVEYVGRYNTRGAKTEFNLQTNGVLLDETWCAFLRKHSFLVGLSFDGSPAVHDAFRVDRAGQNTSAQAVRAIQLMQRAGVEHNILMVLTREAAGRMGECYRYLKKLGVEYLQIIPVLDPYGEKGGRQSYSLSPEELERALIQLFDLWYADFLCRKEIRITYFENIIYKMMGNAHNSCAMNGICALEMVVESDGSVYPCDFYVTDSWKLGELKDKSFLEMLQSQTAADFLRQGMAAATHCRDCRWRGLCQASCRRYRQGESGRHENRYCSAYQGFFEYAGPKMAAVAAALSRD